MTTRFSRGGEGEDAARQRYDESKRTETSARQTNVNFAWVRRQLPTVPTPSSLRARFDDKDSKAYSPCAQRGRDGGWGGCRKSWALRLQRGPRGRITMRNRRCSGARNRGRWRRPIDILTPFAEREGAIGCAVLVKLTVMRVEFERNNAARLGEQADDHARS